MRWYILNNTRGRFIKHYINERLQSGLTFQSLLVPIRPVWTDTSIQAAVTSSSDTPTPSKVTRPKCNWRPQYSCSWDQTGMHCALSAILIGAPVKVGTDVLATMKTSLTCTVRQLHPAWSCHTEFYCHGSFLCVRSNRSLSLRATSYRITQAVAIQVDIFLLSGLHNCDNQVKSPAVLIQIRNTISNT